MTEFVFDEPPPALQEPEKPAPARPPEPSGCLIALLVMLLAIPVLVLLSGCLLILLLAFGPSLANRLDQMVKPLEFILLLM